MEQSLSQENLQKIKTNQERQNKLTSAINEIGKIGVSVDIENATLESIEKSKNEIQGSVANLIVSLDKVTNSFGDSFSTMRQKTTSEKIIGFFSKNKANSMREERLKNSSIKDQLDDLLRQSNILLSLLNQQLVDLELEKTKLTQGLNFSLDERITISKKIEEVFKTIEDLDTPIQELENKIAETLDSADKNELLKQRQLKINEQNEYIKEREVLLAENQSHEKFIKMYQTYLDSTENQISTQKVLINKLKIDTEQRVILYETMSVSLRTAQQQDTAHKINDIGMAVDNQTTELMAGIGAATQNQVVNMLEQHEGHMKLQQEIQERKNRSDEVFYRRLKQVLDQENKR